MSVARKKLTLRPPPAKLQAHTLPPNDPVKVALSNSLGWRFIDRNRRYILQARMVMFAPGGFEDFTWVDVPLVPEVYG
jgi:hypothetical protein